MVEDTGGVPKMGVGKRFTVVCRGVCSTAAVSNGLDPKILEAATHCEGAITALSGRHCLTAAVVVKGGGGGRDLAAVIVMLKTNNNELMMMISCLGVGRGRNLRSLPRPLPPPIVARSAQTTPLMLTYPRRRLPMLPRQRTAPKVQPRSTAEQSHVDC